MHRCRWSPLSCRSCVSVAVVRSCGRCGAGTGTARTAPVTAPPYVPRIVTLRESACTFRDIGYLPVGQVERRGRTVSVGAPAERRAGAHDGAHGTRVRTRSDVGLHPARHRRGSRPGTGPSAASAGGAGMNLVICSLDTLRADHLSCLGNDRGLTPNLDRIASEGALFSPDVRHRHPDPAVPHRAVHRAVRHQHGHRLPLPPGRLPARGDACGCRPMLRRNGYVTGAVDHLFAMKDWFIRGYDDYMPPPGRSRSPGSVINGIGLPWISRAQGRGLLPVPPLLGRPHPLRAAVALQGALLPRHGGPDRPGHHRQARGPAELPAVQAEPLRLPRRHAQPRLHRRPLRRRGGLPRLRDRADLPAPRRPRACWRTPWSSCSATTART